MKIKKEICYYCHKKSICIGSLNEKNNVVHMCGKCLKKNLVNGLKGSKSEEH